MCSNVFMSFSENKAFSMHDKFREVFSLNINLFTPFLSRALLYYCSGRGA
jgi:hypothetical protein